jgi:hypothetical protein
MAAKPMILNKDQVSPLALQLPHSGARTELACQPDPWDR